MSRGGLCHRLQGAVSTAHQHLELVLLSKEDSSNSRQDAQEQEASFDE